MNKKFIITLIVILIVLALAGGLVFAYTMTDIFKSDEQLFYKYMGQVSEKLNNFENQELKQYLEKQEQKPYESEGLLSVDVDVPETDKKLLDAVNNLNIKVSGKTDSAKKLSQQSVKINYSDDIAFPIEYRQNGDLYGITSDILIKKYLAVDNNNLGELLSKFGVIEDKEKIELGTIQNIKISDVSSELSKYKTIIKNNVTSDNFSKSGDTYSLTLSEIQTMTILKQVLEELKKSDVVSEEMKAQIDKEITQIDGLLVECTNEEALKITINKDGNITFEIANLGTIGIQVNNSLITITIQSKEEDNIKISVAQNKSEGQVVYNFNIEVLVDDNLITGYLNATYKGLNENTVKEEYTFGIESNEDEKAIAYDYKLDVAKNFVNEIEIEKMTNNDAVVLNDANSEWISQLFGALLVQISQVNQTQMQQLGLTAEQNPLMLATPLGLLLNQNIQGNTQNNNENGENNGETSGTQDPTTPATDITASSHNSALLPYLGMQSGKNVKSLLQSVIYMNQADPKHIVSVNGSTDALTINDYANSIVDTRDI